MRVNRRAILGVENVKSKKHFLRKAVVRNTPNKFLDAELKEKIVRIICVDLLRLHAT